jgi:hypothetical protein
MVTIRTSLAFFLAILWEVPLSSFLNALAHNFPQNSTQGGHDCAPHTQLLSQYNVMVTELR